MRKKKSFKVIKAPYPIQSLSTSIPHEDGLIALRHFPDQRPDPEPPINTLIRLAELVLQKNLFSFNGSFYIQKSGFAKGSNLGRPFACLFVSYQEEKIFQSYQRTIPHTIVIHQHPTQRWFDILTSFS